MLKSRHTPDLTLSLVFFLEVVFLSPSAYASGLSDLQDWYSGVTQNLNNVYDNGLPTILVPAYTWHDPTTYSQAALATYNDIPLGIGWSKSLINADGNSEMLSGMVFVDSGNHLEPVVSYTKQWLWAPFAGNFKLGGGYSAGVTARADIDHYIPVPFVLPAASICYGTLTLNITIVPEIKNITPNTGNVALFSFNIPY